MENIGMLRLYTARQHNYIASSLCPFEIYEKAIDRAEDTGEKVVIAMNGWRFWWVIKGEREYTKEKGNLYPLAVGLSRMKGV